MAETIEQRIQRLLAERGVKIKLGGCGCCGSPWLKLEIDGETVFDDDDAYLDSWGMPPAERTEGK